MQPLIAFSIKEIQFISLEKDRSKFEIVKEIFEKMIRPVYGEIAYTLEKIRKSLDRRCEFLVSKDFKQHFGLLIYKTALTDEFAELGISKSLEIKTLLVINPQNNSGKGIGSALLKRVEAIAGQLHANSLHVTISEIRPEALKFFQKNHFKVRVAWPDRYKNGVTEYLLSKSLKQKAEYKISLKITALVSFFAIQLLNCFNRIQFSRSLFAFRF